MNNDDKARLERENPVIKAMHKAKPARVRIVERGGGAREVRISQGRNRWRTLADTLDALAWERVEGLDEAGAVIVMVTAEGDDDEGTPEMASERVDDVRALVALMRDVQRDTLREARAIYAAQADAVGRVLDAATDALRTAQSAFDITLKVQAAAMAKGDDGPEGVGVAQMMQMAMMLAQNPNKRPLVPPPKAPLAAVPKEGQWVNSGGQPKEGA